jgi:opacity protein-like surface antigen
MRRSSVFVLLLFLFVSVIQSAAQQEYVSRYDAFVGYSYLNSPKLSLSQNGFHTQFGVNAYSWAALGVDFSYFNGNSTLHTSDLNSTQLAKLAPIVPLLPPGFVIQSPYDATTYTMTGGPQFSIRKFKAVTIFVRPSIGAMHESVTAKPPNAMMTQIVAGLVGPSMKKNDTEIFYGAGGGVDLNFSKHLAVRAQMDFVRVGLFTDLLTGSQNNIRFSIGPTFRFGKNIQKPF